MTAVSPFTRLDVEAFTLSNGESNVHFEADDDLAVSVKPARGSGSVAGLVLLELGIDGYQTHRARVDVFGASEDPEEYHYGSDQLAALDDAIDALMAVRDQLAVMRTAAEAREAEHNAFKIGADAQRLGVLDK